MSESPRAVPDLAALYLHHKDAMYRVAASVLREAGLVHFAADAVQDAIVSMMTSPPSGIPNGQPCRRLRKLTRIPNQTAIISQEMAQRVSIGRALAQSPDVS